ncbi:MAG: aldolase [Pirellulales bacterium]|nr:aldolase [Pirellulales bacterium]
MPTSRVRQRWAAGKPALGTVAYFTDPASAELISLLGFDCIWIDLEHQSTSVAQAAQMIRAARVGQADVMARPGKGEFMRLGRLLEAGATGIIYPRCDNAAEAREVVRWTKFAPLGERGYMGVNPDASYGMVGMAEYLGEANRRTWLAIQIESPAALGQAREIAQIEGVDVVFFGSSDFSVLSGVPGQFDSETVQQAMRQLCRETLAAGKRFGTYVNSVEQARLAVELGASLVCYGIDLLFVKSALENVKRQFAALGFQFGATPDPLASFR